MGHNAARDELHRHGLPGPAPTAPGAAEWREELRRLLLTEELLALPQAVQELATEVRRLAELQARTHEEVGRLVQAQTRADEQSRRLEAALAELAEAQRRTEERAARLEHALAELAEAQRRTEERVGHLERAVVRLADAQARTEQVVQQLAQQVGRLSDAVGFTLEELARELAPAYLAERHGIRVAALERRFFTVDGEEVEVDFFGEGTRDGEPVVVLGGVRSRTYGRAVGSLARRAQALAPQLTGTPVPVLFGFVVRPSAVEVAARTGGPGGAGGPVAACPRRTSSLSPFPLPSLPPCRASLVAATAGRRLGTVRKNFR